MRIKRLKLSGFKSFVEPAELHIEPGLTGVVGPNGCGKSNLLEAIRWVMGEGSAKSLRGGAMDDVIFAGTEKRPSRDFAEVSILAERDATGDDRELEIVRRIERGAGSAYRLNGRDVRAKDVALVFADAATGAHSPALVSQGRIGAVIAAKPVDRRAMLEEAAGISGLHVRRKDAEQKLRATETNLNRLNEVLGDMEARASTLRRQARAAERYRKLSADIRVAEGRMIFARWRDAAAAALGQHVDDRTSRMAVPHVALLYQFPQHPLHGREVSNLLLDQTQLASGQRLSLAAGARHIQGQQCGHLIEREAERLCPLDESHTLGLLRRIAPMPTEWLGRLIQQAAPLVVANRLDIHTGSVSQQIAATASLKSFST